MGWVGSNPVFWVGLNPSHCLVAPLILGTGLSHVWLKKLGIWVGWQFNIVATGIGLHFSSGTLELLEFNQGWICKSFSLSLLHQEPYKRNQIGFLPFLLLSSYRELRRRPARPAAGPAAQRAPLPDAPPSPGPPDCDAAGEGSAAAEEEEDGAARSGPWWSGKKKMGRRRRPEMGDAAGWRGAARGVASTTDGEDGEGNRRCLREPTWLERLRSPNFEGGVESAFERNILLWSQPNPPHLHPNSYRSGFAPSQPPTKHTVSCQNLVQREASGLL